MAKKSNRKGAAATEKPKYDDTKYGEVRYSFSYSMGDEDYLDAKSLVGPANVTQYLSLASMALLVIVIFLLYDRSHVNMPLLIVTIVLLIVLGFAMTSWPKIVDRYISSTNIASKGGSLRHVVVTSDTLVVEGPDGQVATYPLAELKRVPSFENGALAKFGGRRYVYIPRRALSNSRYDALIKFLRSQYAK